MSTRRSFSCILILLFALSCKPLPLPRVLLFTRTAGFRHQSIDAGKAAIIQLGKQHGFEVDATEDASRFNDSTLSHYRAVIFLHTTGDLFNREQEVALERYIQAGGGFAGIHAAADAEYDWRWYGRLVGGYFDSHPAIQQATINTVYRNHESTKPLPTTWQHTDEWYNFKWMYDSVTVLLTVAESTYTGGTQGNYHPIAWFHDYDGGRAWYTALGHTNESYSDSMVLAHLYGGISYAIGALKPLDYSKATSVAPPPDSLLEKTLLTGGTLSEPTEMAVLPNLDVLIAQRTGELMLYRDADHSIEQVAKLAVYSKSHTKGVNAEEGLLGLTTDPAFAQNHFIYLFYSPADTSVNRLSRFVFEGDSLVMSSEKVVLQFYSQREICCHTGGSLAFAPNGDLFISTGDNSTPFDEPGQRYVSAGFSPTDDRLHHEQYDARRSAANSNDLRGKILRIHPKSDGTYDIPAGNLFAAGTPNTKPEIFVMGTRNPYRISVDPKSGTLYWGEVGPDAAHDTLATRGPKGYDEVNQAKHAGFFGWPLFVGNNFAYHAFDYATGKSGPAYDAAKPVNDSRNNTGLRDLPPAQPAFIWYPYDSTEVFPKVGNGGRTAMAGPVYHPDRMRTSSTALPSYYDGKLFIYDWIRGWIMAVSLTPAGEFDRMERIMPREKFASPIDMEVGPDGRIYVLEYGTGWFKQNTDAGLSRIGVRGRK